jgi:4-hydroxy-2-oxoheptanedioate aldolase
MSSQPLFRPSRVLREIRAGGVATCAKVSLSDPRAVEIAGLSGFSSVWICCEHTPNDWRNVEDMVRAAKLHDVDAIVRVSKGSYSDYLKPFECDATGIMVPHVTTAEEARRIVDFCRFHPVGRRPLDGGSADGAFGQIPTQDYVSQANAERFLIFQIESPEAVANVDEIAAVEGYDFLLFGPGDYAHLIGKPGCIHDSEVKAARRRVEAAARRCGKKCFGVACEGSPAELRERGYVVVCLAYDAIGLGGYFRKCLEEWSRRREGRTHDASWENAATVYEQNSTVV